VSRTILLANWCFVVVCRASGDGVRPSVATHVRFASGGSEPGVQCSGLGDEAGSAIMLEKAERQAKQGAGAALSALTH
jgi:hypothetical protein